MNANPLEKFRQSNGLSFAALAQACGGSAVGCNRTAITALCRDAASAKTAIVPHIIRNLHGWMRRQGHDRLTISRELKKIRAGLQPAPIKTAKTTEQEPIMQAIRLESTEWKFFGLDRDPFAGPPIRINGDVKSLVFYEPPSLRRILSEIETAILYQGFVSVTASIGAGKTELTRQLRERSNRSKIKIVWPTAQDLTRVTDVVVGGAILRAFQQRVPCDPHERSKRLEALLEQCAENGVSVAIAFDEAHRLTDAMLTALKNFYELRGGYAGFALLLFGQNSFKERILSDVRFSEIAARLEFKSMPPFTQEDAWGYVGHRLALVGGNAESLFERAVIDRIWETAKTPLALGNACNAALKQAFAVQSAQVTIEVMGFDSPKYTVKKTKSA